MINLTKFPFLTSITNPPPTLVFFKGKFREDEMKKQRINEEEVFQAIRKKTGGTSDQVCAVILESDGSLSVITNISPGYSHEITKYISK